MALTPVGAADRKAPIGVFDSGVGGLTVARELARQLPNESLVYLGDTARTPYGTKAGETVTRFSLECVTHLRRYRIKALVVACNTASAVALPALRRQLDLPVFGVIEPGARAAREADGGRPVGVIGTAATIASEAYPRAVRRHDARLRVFSQACPLLVPLVEEGWLAHPVTVRVARTYLTPLLTRGIGSLILGCTHYPALKPILAKICGKRVRLIDSAEEVAKEVSEVLGRRNMRNVSRRAGRRIFLVTDVAAPFKRVGRHLMGPAVSRVRRVRIPAEGRRV